MLILSEKKSTEVLDRGSCDKALWEYEKSQTPFALILADVDYFKRINDTCGHAAGDHVLKRVAEILKGEFREIDFVCRVGGDEFAVIMSEVSLSIGVAFSAQENGKRTVFKSAAQALYYVKEHGKNGYAFTSKE